MKRILAGLIGLIMLLAALAAGAAEITGPSEVQTGKPVWYSLTVPPGASGAFFPAPHIDAGEHVKTGSALFWAEKPGRYAVHAVVIDWAGKQIFPLAKQVTVKGEGPDPNPTPDPAAPWAEWAQRAAGRTVSEAGMKHARPLALSIRGYCSEAAGITSLRQFREGMRRYNRAGLGDAACNEWEAFGDALDDALDDAYSDKAPTLREAIQVYLQVADGIERAGQ